MTSVLLDGLHLTTASANRGIGTYLRNLIRHLPATGIEPSVLTTDPAAVPGSARGVRIRRPVPGRFVSALHARLLPRDIRRVDVDVVHSPALDPPRRIDRPWVQTLHDVTPLIIDDPFFAGERKHWQAQAPLLRSADAIIAVSRYSAERGVETLGLDPARVHVVHNGVDARFTPGPAPTNPGSRPYVLYVGEYGAHKGYAEAFEVVARLAADGHPHDLKVIGSIAPWYEQAITELRARAPRPDLIELLGFVSDVVPYYQQASALVMTSRQEGFGLPVVEAMACGTPVVAFDNSALTEVVAGGGVLVPDGDVDAFAVALSDLLADESVAASLSEQARQRADSFSWAKAAAGHAAVYRSVARR